MPRPTSSPRSAPPSPPSRSGSRPAPTAVSAASATAPCPARATPTPRSCSSARGPASTRTSRGGRSSAPSGKFLDELLAGIGLDRKKVFIANVVKCRPPNNRDPQPDEIAACGKYLDAQIAAIEPKVIVTLGRHSMQRYFPGESISRIHGTAAPQGRPHRRADVPPGRRAAPGQPAHGDRGRLRAPAGLPRARSLGGETPPTHRQRRAARTCASGAPRTTREHEPAAAQRRLHRTAKPSRSRCGSCKGRHGRTNHCASSRSAVSARSART